MERMRRDEKETKRERGGREDTETFQHGDPRNLKHKHETCVAQVAKFKPTHQSFGKNVLLKGFI